jgi:TetR/AcrR family transcriptional regulator
MRERRQKILETLASELSANPGKRITTAVLAKSVGVSEAALYRHFPSKARMFEGLIEFAEDSIFTRINRILEDDRNTQSRCAKVVYLLLGFADRNPGIVRVLLGNALVGEHERLQERVQGFFDRLQTQFRQILRESELRQDVQLGESPGDNASLLMAYIEGRMQQLLRSRFQMGALENWEADWRMLSAGMFH